MNSTCIFAAFDNGLAGGGSSFWILLKPDTFVSVFVPSFLRLLFSDFPLSEGGGVRLGFCNFGARDGNGGGFENPTDPASETLSSSPSLSHCWKWIII